MTELDPTERALGEALCADAAPQPGDADLLGKLIDGVVQAPPAATPSRIGKLGWRVIAGGGGIVGAAALWIALSHSQAIQREAPRPTPAVPTIIEPTASVASPEPTTESVIAIESLPRVAPSPSAFAPAHHATAAELFSKANDARNHSEDADAVAGYQALQHDFPDSVEAKASHVMLGRLLLERRSDARGALDQFDAYLTGAPGTLREEALIGRARSLDRLGRTDESRAAWKLIVDLYPSSLYADEAHARLDALGH